MGQYETTNVLQNLLKRDMDILKTSNYFETVVLRAQDRITMGFEVSKTK